VNETPPSPEALCAASALLATLGDRIPGGVDREAIAASEFAFYSAQTYLFERAGEALLMSMSAATEDNALLAAFARQAAEEKNHVFAYERALRLLGDDAGAAFVRALGGHEGRLVRGSLLEKMVLAFVVLESLAMGIFEARRRVYAGTALAALDARFLVEEAEHQRVGVQLVARVLAAHGTPANEAHAMVAEGARTVLCLLDPSPLFACLGLEVDAREREAYASAGFLAVQREVTRRAMANGLRALHRATPRAVA
jgi:hypothetical protein